MSPFRQGRLPIQTVPVASPRIPYARSGTDSVVRLTSPCGQRRSQGSRHRSTAKLSRLLCMFIISEKCACLGSARKKNLDGRERARNRKLAYNQKPQTHEELWRLIDLYVTCKLST
eukprot:2751205-Rhodomonas_salina.1